MDGWVDFYPTHNKASIFTIACGFSVFTQFLSANILIFYTQNAPFVQYRILLKPTASLYSELKTSCEMASLRLAKLRTGGCNVTNMLGLCCNHIAAMTPPLDKAVNGNIFLPEFDRKAVEDPNTNFEIGVPSYLYSGSMELMAVPKKKVSALYAYIRIFLGGFGFGSFLLAMVDRVMKLTEGLEWRRFLPTKEA